MPLRRWLDSVNHAIEGILHAAKTQRHVRFHLYAAAGVMVLSFGLGVTGTEFIIIGFCVALVIVAELLNSALEEMVDLLSPQYHEKARTAKDIAAGAVFISALVSVVVAYVVLLPYLEVAFKRGLRIAKHSPDEVAMVAVLTVLILVVITKAYFGRGTPLRGGLPSGHAALAFSFWVSISLVTSNFVVSLMGLVVAIIISQSRVAIKVHTPWEVILGALLGSSVTFLLFLVFT